MLERLQVVVRELSQRDLSAAEAASLSRQSPRMFRRRFTALMGLSFRVARLRAKLARGALLLQTTSLSIAAISTDLGYTDRTKFEKAFRRTYGITPTVYRKQLQGAGAGT